MEYASRAALVLLAEQIHSKMRFSELFFISREESQFSSFDGTPWLVSS
jgi:hypothetical protein